MLLSRAENLNVVVDNERAFWSEALLLRQNNWCMGAGLAGKQISVNYGYHNGNYMPYLCRYLILTMVTIPRA